MMARYVVDASALLALLKAEAGSDQVIEAITEGAVICSVNFSEVVAKLNESGMPEQAIHETLDSLELAIVKFDTENAYQAGLLRSQTRAVGLSPGDRACLALASYLNLPALTTDRIWKDVIPGIKVEVIR